MPRHTSRTRATRATRQRTSTELLLARELTTPSNRLNIAYPTATRMITQPGNLAPMQMTISDAAEYLQVSPQTVRRRLHTGVLKGDKVRTPQGFTWLIEMQEITEPVDASTGNRGDLVALLQNQLVEKDRQISELHQLLARTALPPAPAPPAWWQFWK